MSLKYNPGPLLLAGAVSGGGAWYDTTRAMAFGGFTGVAEGEQDLGIVNGGVARRLRVRRPAPLLQADPRCQPDASWSSAASPKAAATAPALTVAGRRPDGVLAGADARSRHRVVAGNGTLVRPLIRAGAIWYEGADFALTASFAGAPAGVVAVHHQHQHRRGDGPRRCRRRSDQRRRCGAAAVIRRPARRDDADPQRRHQGQRKF